MRVEVSCREDRKRSIGFSLEEFGARRLISSVNLVYSGLNGRLTVPGQLSNGLAGRRLERLKPFPEVEGSSKLNDATPFAEWRKDLGMNVLLKAGYCFRNPVKGRVGCHVASLIAENPKSEHGLIRPQSRGGMIDFPTGIDTNSMNSGPNPANPVG